ncbi:glycosyltransferase family 4 protein [Alkalibacter mobilis]|uniref:glycosyltransferase family 4 protein n=1 Tax=Alkalibacter mobilis TaxID=2787712 RepID=UPI0018A0D847|nr:glycosyltransferase family 4 protein [Alkalibacter mobilis]MBF7096129.1 glycosyltransferase family 4 protein [Alkalibacter mobilis]
MSEFNNKNKTIWIINQHNMPPEYGHLNRHYNLGKFLKKNLHDPVVFVGSFLHNKNRQVIEDGSLYKVYDKSDYPYVFIKTMDYSKSMFKRVLSMFQFYLNLMKAEKEFKKPDVILGSSSHPLSAFAAIKLARKYKCMSVVEIRDLWPESFFAYNIIKKSNPLAKLFYRGERWLYDNADKIIFTMEGGRDYILEQRWDKASGGTVDIDKVHHLNNGVDLALFDKNKEIYKFNDPDLDDETTFKVIYTGSIRLVNNVKAIVDAAEYLKKNGHEKIQFLIYGEGEDRRDLEKYCTENSVDNLIFKGYADKNTIPFILSRSDLNIVHFEQSNLKKYGASLNKLFEYFASGKPTVSDCEFGYDLIKRYDCGIVIDNASAREIGEAVLKFKNMEKETYQRYCKNARKAAVDYDYEILAKKFIEIIGSK